MSLDALLPAALAGTGRRAGAPDPAEPWAAALPADAPERALLLRAGAHAGAAFAGKRALDGITPTEPAGPEPLAPCAAGAAAYVFGLAQEQETRRVAIEALALMRARGLRLPHAMLPEVLATGDATLRKALAPVLGARGAWLAGFRDDWAWGRAGDAFGDPAAATRAWDEGTPAVRLEALVAMRAMDPAQARAWVAGAAGDKAEQRASFLQALGAGLSPADEPVVTAALQDRAASVRLAAAKLLVRLPGSALGATMAARADEVVAGNVKRFLIRKGLTFLPPEVLPADWAKDGLDAKPPNGVGPRAWWLFQLIGLVPLAHWERRFGASPAEVAAAFAADPDWGVHAAGGLAAAALEQDAPAWLEAAYDALRPFSTHAGGMKDAPLGVVETFPAVVPRLPARRLGERALAELAEARYAGPASAVGHLRALPRPWDRAFSEAFLAALARHVQAVGDRYESFRDPWLPAMEAAALGLAPGSEARIPELPAPDRPVVRNLAQSLDRLRRLSALRRRLLEEIVP